MIWFVLKLHVSLKEWIIQFENHGGRAFHQTAIHLFPNKKHMLNACLFSKLTSLGIVILADMFPNIRPPTWKDVELQKFTTAAVKTPPNKANFLWLSLEGSEVGF